MTHRIIWATLAGFLGLILGAVVGVAVSFGLCFPLAIAMDDGRGGGGAIVMAWGFFIAPVCGIVGGVIGAGSLVYKMNRWIDRAELNALNSRSF